MLMGGLEPVVKCEFLGVASNYIVSQFHSSALLVKYAYGAFLTSALCPVIIFITHITYDVLYCYCCSLHSFFFNDYLFLSSYPFVLLVLKYFLLPCDYNLVPSFFCFFCLKPYPPFI